MFGALGAMLVITALLFFLIGLVAYAIWGGV